MAWHRIDAETATVVAGAAATPAERQLAKTGQGRLWLWFGLGIFVTIGVSSMLLAQSRPEPSTPDEALTRRLELLLRSMRIARERHVLKPDNQQLLNGAIRGLLDKLDPEAVLYTPEDLGKAQVAGAHLAFSTGITVQRLAIPPRGTGPAYRITGTSDGSPAARAGLRAGDLIAQIDGIPTAGISAADIRAKSLESRDAGFVELSIIRGPTGPALDIALEREPRQAPNNSLIRMPDGTALLRIAAFNAKFRIGSERNDFSLNLAPIGDALAVIIDLRDLGGGTRDDAIAFADAFLETGTIVTLESRAGKGSQSFKARTGDVARGKPVAILVNGGTSQAAEIVAAALQANKRAMLFGTQTAGRGSDYRVFDLGNGRGSILLKAERYISPAGHNLDKSGIKPDVEIKQGKDPALSACREIDRPGEGADGQCERRPVAHDATLQAALAHVSGQAKTAKP